MVCTYGIQNEENGEYRLCVAYIGLNAQTQEESWPLSNIKEAFDGQEDSKIKQFWMESVGLTISLLRGMINILILSITLGAHSAI